MLKSDTISRLIHFKLGNEIPEIPETVIFLKILLLIMSLFFKILCAWPASGGGKGDVAEAETVSRRHKVT